MNIIEDSIFPEREVVYAKFATRFYATLVDILILLIPFVLISIFLPTPRLFILLMSWLYSAIMVSGPRQATYGKRAYWIKVTDMNGERISFANATGRHFAKYVSTITAGIGYLMNLWDGKGQTLHDKVAGTLVVTRPKVF